MPSSLRSAASVAQLYRPLWRLAAEHDKSSHLNLLLPHELLSGSATSSAPPGPDAAPRPAVEQLREGFRNPKSVEHDYRQVAMILHSNIHRDALWQSQLQTAHAQPQPVTAGHHPNLGWFQAQIEDKGNVPMAIAELKEAGEQNEFDIVKCMLHVGCHPTSEIYLQVLHQLSCRHGAFQHVLGTFWFWELYGAADGHISSHGSQAASTLVKSALLDQTLSPCTGSWRHPVRVWQALLGPHTCWPGRCITNQLLRRVASVGQHTTSAEEMREVAGTLQEAAREAIRRQVALDASTYHGLLRAFSRAGKMEAAFDCAVSMASLGSSIPAEMSLELLEWAAEEGDKERAIFLEEELAASGKAQYLAAINSPSC